MRILCFFTLALLIPSFEFRLCRRRCGLDKEAVRINPTENDIKTGDDLRVVNGYEPPPRSFLVLIKVRKDESTCGGTIVNNRYVLTAGHCVCLMGSDVIPCQDKKLLYPTEDINLLVGVNNKDVTDIDRLIGVQVLIAKQVILHPNWDGTGYPNLPDLAVIRTNKKIKFSPGTVGPICFPSKRSKVHNKKVYAGGWGVTGGAWLTDSNGPSKYLRCRKPFSYKGQVFDGCLTSDSPSIDDSICQQFLKSVGRSKYNEKTKNPIKIIYSNRKETICYKLENEGHGWCGSCRREANEGELGHCDPFNDYQIEDETMTQVSTTEDWGFCSKQCSDIELEASRLMEINLVALRKKECKILIGNSNVLQYDANMEICAGHKIQFPKRRVFRRYKVKGLEDNFVFKRKKSEINRLNITGPPSKLNFYIGHGDSCQGDSGGPLYRFQRRRGRKRAVIAGVVSRGEQCAGFNQPGIYTNVAKFKKWIRRQTKSGKCK